MKHLILIGCLFVSFNCLAQKKAIKHITNKHIVTIDPNGILGIGILKLGSDSSILIKYAIDSLNRIADPIGFESLQWRIDEDKNGKFKELLRLKDREIKKSYCPNVTEYYLSEYKIAGIIIKNIYLKYFDGKLIEVKSDYNIDIETALEVKYGKSKLSVQRIPCKCLYNITGIEKPLEERIFTNEWRNGPIYAWSVLSKKYDDHCKEEMNNYFILSIESNKIINCESESLKKSINIKTPNKKSLKDF